MLALAESDPELPKDEAGPTEGRLRTAVLKAQYARHVRTLAFSRLSANDKRHARVAVLKHVAKTLKNALNLD